jgi:hypothetical protein
MKRTYTDIALNDGSNAAKEVPDIKKARVSSTRVIRIHGSYDGRIIEFIQDEIMVILMPKIKNVAVVLGIESKCSISSEIHDRFSCNTWGDPEFEFDT